MINPAEFLARIGLAREELRVIEVRTTPAESRRTRGGGAIPMPTGHEPVLVWRIVKLWTVMVLRAFKFVMEKDVDGSTSTITESRAPR